MCVGINSTSDQAVGRTQCSVRYQGVPLTKTTSVKKHIGCGGAAYSLPVGLNILQRLHVSCDRYPGSGIGVGLCSLYVHASGERLYSL